MMAGTSWLVAMMLFATGTAQAQYAPAQGAPAQALPAQLTPAQAAPLTQTAPPEALPVQAAPAQAPYVPLPAIEVGGAMVPPYPGPMPSVFSSATEFADYGTWRLERLTARERSLTRVGRPDNYVAQRVGGFALLATGGGMLLACLSLAVLDDPTPTSSDAEDDLDRRREIGLASAALVGIGLVIGGAVWLSHLKRDNPYRQEITALHKERGRLGKDIQRARRQMRAEQGFTFNLERLQVRF